MDKSQLALAIAGVLKACKGVELAMIKFDQVIQGVNDVLIHETNSPSIDELDAPSGADELVELDDEKVAWSAKFHTATKTQVASKIVKGGKAWRLLKKIDNDELAAYKAKFINVTPTNEQSGVPALPGTGVPALPGTGVPVPEPSKESELRRECIVVIKSLIDVYGLSWDDCKEIMVEQFKSAQNGDEVTFGGLTFEQFPLVLEFFTALKVKYDSVQKTIDDITAIAGVANAPTVSAGLAEIFAQFHCETLSGVYYGDIDKCTELFKNWLDVWVKWSKG